MAANQVNTGLPEGFELDTQSSPVATASGSPASAPQNAELPAGFQLDSAKAAVSETDSGVAPGNKLYTSKDPQTGEDVTQMGLRNVAKDPAGALVDTFANAALSMARGTYGAAARFDRAIDGLDKLQSKVTGLGGQGYFDTLAQRADAVYKALPKSGFDPITQSAFELAAGAPADVAQFMATRGALGAAGKAIGATQGAQKLTSGIDQAIRGIKPTQLATVADAAKESLSGIGLRIQGDAAAIGVTQALDEYSKSDDLKASGQAFKNGYLIGNVVPAAGAIVSKGINLMQTFGKNAAEGYIKFVTGNEDLAKDFVNDPKKYNTNPFQNSAKMRDQFNASRDEQVSALNERHKAERLQFEQAKDDRKFAVEDKLNAAKASQRDTLEATKQNFMGRKQETLENLVAKNDADLTAFDSALQEKYAGIFDNFGQGLKVARQQAGEAVGTALKSAMELDPLIALPAKPIQGKVYSVINEVAPFEKRGNKFVPSVNVADNSDVKVFNNYLEQFNGLVKEGKLSIKFLQDSKDALGNLASKYYSKGDGKLGRMYQELSKTLNPVSMLDIKSNPWLWVKSGTGIDAHLKEIAEANKGYYDVMQKHDRAMQYYFDETPQGDLIPKQQQVIKAIRDNNVPLLRQMKAADLALPPKDRILPQIGQVINERDQMLSTQKAIVRNQKKKLRDEAVIMKQTNLALQRELATAQRGAKAEEVKAAQEKLFAFNQRMASERATVEGRLSDQEQFLLRQEQLRSVIAGTPVAKMLQLVGGVSSLPFGGSISIPRAAAGASMSPIVAANLVKAGIGSNRAYNNTIGRAVNPALNQFDRIAEAAKGGIGKTLDEAIKGKRVGSAMTLEMAVEAAKQRKKEGAKK